MAGPTVSTQVLLRTLGCDSSKVWKITWFTEGVEVFGAYRLGSSDLGFGIGSACAGV